jgi:hypothetical protein
MLKFGHDYVDRGVEFYEAKYQHRQLDRIRKQAAALHMELIPLPRVISQVSEEWVIIHPECGVYSGAASWPKWTFQSNGGIHSCDNFA